MQASPQQRYGDAAGGQEGTRTGARSAGLRVSGGAAFQATTPGMHLREVKERSSGQMCWARACLSVLD